MSNTRPTISLVSIAEAARVTGVSTKTIRRRISDGTIPAHRFGPRLLRISMSDVEAALRAVPTAARAA